LGNVQIQIKIAFFKLFYYSNLLVAEMRIRVYNPGGSIKEKKGGLEMRIMKPGLFVIMIVVFGVGLLFTGCKKEKKAKVTRETSVSGAKEEPEWVTRCAGAFEDAGKEAFYGCGAVSGIQNRALQIQSADERARVDLARALDTYVAGFMKDYMSSAASEDLSDAEEKQFVESITKSITEATLYGSQVVDRWRGPDDTLYSLCKVSFDNVAQSMRKAMKARAEELRMNADEALRQLDEQLEKRREAGM
jgi:hypothetical protein